MGAPSGGALAYACYDVTTSCSLIAAVLKSQTMVTVCVLWYRSIADMSMNSFVIRVCSAADAPQKSLLSQIQCFAENKLQ